VETFLAVFEFVHATVDKTRAEASRADVNIVNFMNVSLGMAKFSTAALSCLFLGS
jgi:hypothetical protein